VEELAALWHVCAACSHHHPMPVGDWVRLLLDEEKLEVWDEHVVPTDPLKFDDGKPPSRRWTGPASASR
jgi:acetyl-CoA carboxylase carboxyl transferase subunit beta